MPVLVDENWKMSCELELEFYAAEPAIDVLDLDSTDGIADYACPCRNIVSPPLNISKAKSIRAGPVTEHFEARDDAFVKRMTSHQASQAAVEQKSAPLVIRARSEHVRTDSGLKGVFCGRELRVRRPRPSVWSAEAYHRRPLLTKAFEMYEEVW